MFRGGPFGPFVGEALTAEPTAKMNSDYARLRSAIGMCHSFGFAGDGRRMMFKLSPISFGGPGSLAVRMDAMFEGIHVNGYLAIDHLGNVALLYYFYQFESGSSQLASVFYIKAIDKAQRTL